MLFMVFNGVQDYAGQPASLHRNAYLLSDLRLLLAASLGTTVAAKCNRLNAIDALAQAVCSLRRTAAVYRPAGFAAGSAAGSACKEA